GFEELVCDARRRAKPGVKPLELSREASRLNILLPLGSSEGEYDVRIARQSGESLLEKRYGPPSNAENVFCQL
ncbi:MAG TPA: hypothetical protein VGX94_03775, partial [Terriglobia bacterium]|nr:hypothetical protein [Terriglobia bacterium]